MRVVRKPGTIAALFAAFTAAACGSAGQPRPQTEPGPAATSGEASNAASTAELEALYRSRTESARTRFTDADVHFMTGMISHHGQALVMAGLAPTHGASPTLLRLTTRIINAQTDEIATMQGWLRDRGQPVPEVRVEGTTLVVEGAAGGVMQMAGMLTPEQMRNLDAARGPEFDRLFLTYMIQHHRGAVTMVHDLFGVDGAAQGRLAFKLASDIQVDQLTEIERMELMLDKLTDAGGPQR